jgi:hypothetical protein
MNTKFTAILILVGCTAMPMFGQSAPSSYGQGINLKVNCGQKALGTLPTINAALKLLAPSMTNTVTVSGSCNENVQIQGFDRLTLISTTGATINDASGGQSTVVDIEDSRHVTLQGFTINGGLDGVVCGNASVCYLTANTIQSSVGQEGVGVGNGSRAFLTNNVIKNNGTRTQIQVLSRTPAHTLPALIPSSTTPEMAALCSPIIRPGESSRAQSAATRGLEWRCNTVPTFDSIRTPALQR